MTRLLAALALLAAPAFAQDPAPEELVRRITDEIMAAIQSDKALAAGDRQRALRLAEEKILPHVDFEEATRLAVGRSWAGATPQQRAQLTAEFRNMLVRTYSNAIGVYRGQTMKVLPSRTRPADGEATVRNQFLRPGAAPLLVDYSMRKTDAGWKVYDIVVEGVSLVLTYRSEFDAVARQDGVDGLIMRLAQKNTPAALGGTAGK